MAGIWGDGPAPAWAAAGAAALDAVAAGYRPPGRPRREPPDLWAPVLDLERRGHQLLTLSLLKGAGLVAFWRVGRADCAVLTPLALERLGCWVESIRAGAVVRAWKRARIDERWGRVTVTERWDEHDRLGRPRRRKARVTKLAPAEVVAGPCDPEPDPIEPPEPRSCPLADWMLARFVDDRAQDDPVERAIAREEAARDAATGRAVVLREGQELRLFAGDGGAGVAVAIDPRLGRKSG